MYIWGHRGLILLKECRTLGMTFLQFHRTRKMRKYTRKDMMIKMSIGAIVFMDAKNITLIRFCTAEEQISSTLQKP